MVFRDNSIIVLRLSEKSLFMLINNASDACLDYLLRANETNGIDI